jgi:hypothetical protein
MPWIYVLIVTILASFLYAVSTPDKKGDTAVTYVLASASALYI